MLFVVLWLYSRQAAARDGDVGLVPRRLRRVSDSSSSSCACRINRSGYLALGWVTMGQILSAPMIIAGAVLFVLAHRRGDRARRRSDAAVPRSAAGHQRARRAQGRPHRHGHALAVRPPDALRSRRRASRCSRRRSCTCARSSTSCLWFLQGDTNVQYLRDNDVTIWDEWADENGDLGPRLRRAVAHVAHGRRPAHRSDPARARSDPQRAELAPHHRERLERRRARRRWRWRRATRCSSSTSRRAGCRCQLYQRSADVFLGVPFNIASYALLHAHDGAADGSRVPASSCGRAAIAICT